MGDNKMKQERIIRFPVPDFVKDMFDDFTSLAACSSYCICNQEIIHGDDYGPYGSNTIEMEFLFSCVFGKISIWNPEGIGVIDRGNCKNNGLVFFDDNLFLEKLSKDLQQYHILETKSRLSGKDFTSSIKKPLLFNIINNGKLSISVINELLVNKVNFYITDLTGTGGVADGAMMLFSENIWEKIVSNCKKEILYV